MTDRTDPLPAAQGNGAGAGADDATQILEGLLSDQRHRCQAGQSFTVESYLQQHASLASNPDAVLDLIYNEMVLRESCGETPRLEEYVRRFPQLAEQLQTQFEVESALHSDAADDTWKTRVPSRPPTDGPLPRAAGEKAGPENTGYELLELLGRGGMGVVYKARQRGLNRFVALKMMQSGPYASPEDLARLRIEAEAVARLQHPNIVQIFEVGELDGSPFLALEYVAGGSLAQQLRGTPWPVVRAAELLETVARAVHCAHERGIVHRDLKPANILLQQHSAEANKENDDTARGNKDHTAGPASFPSLPSVQLVPKITDFGLAKLTTGNSSALTQTGDFLGTPGYTAPEQTVGDLRAIGPATDVYALGAILYELLTGRPPFQAPNVLETLELVRTQEPVPPSRLQSKLPRDIETICLKCLQKDTRRRYGSALQLAADVHRFRTGQPILARPIRWTERAWKWARRRPAAAALIAVVTVAALSLAIGGWWSAQRQSALRRQAEANFAKAVSAVELMLTEVGDIDLADVPQLEPVRKKLLLRAKGFYDDFLAKSGDDPRLRYLAGRALSRLASIQDMLDEHVAAEQSYVKACAFLEQSAASTENRRELGRALNGLGGLLKKTGRLMEAEETLRRALDLRRQLAAELDGPDLRQELALSYYELGTVLARLPEQRAPARQAYHEALVLQKPLSDAHPDNADYQRDRARTLNNLGILLRGTSPEEAEQALQEAAGIHQALVDKHPAVPGYRRELARTYNNLAGLFAVTARAEKAEEYFDRALELLRHLAADFPSVPIHRHDLAGVYNSLGLFFEKSRRFAEAGKAYRQSLRLREKLALDAPEVQEYQHGLGLVCLNLGSLLQKQRVPVEPERHYRRAVVVLQALARPGARPAYHSDLALALHGRAMVLLGRSEWSELTQQPHLVLQSACAGPWSGVALALHTRLDLSEAQACLDQAIHFQRAACDADPENKTFPRLLHKHYYFTAGVQLRLGNHREAANAARELPRAYPKDAAEYVRAAEYLARCIPLAQVDGGLSARERATLIDSYASGAVKFLQDAITRGFSNLQELRTLPAYEPLRQRPDFIKLLNQLEKNAPRIG